MAASRPRAVRPTNATACASPAGVAATSIQSGLAAACASASQACPATRSLAGAPSAASAGCTASTVPSAAARRRRWPPLGRRSTATTSPVATTSSVMGSPVMGSPVLRPSWGGTRRSQESALAGRPAASRMSAARAGALSPSSRSRMPCARCSTSPTTPHHSRRTWSVICVSSTSTRWRLTERAVCHQTRCTTLADRTMPPITIATSAELRPILPPAKRRIRRRLHARGERRDCGPLRAPGPARAPVRRAGAAQARLPPGHPLTPPLTPPSGPCPAAPRAG